MTSTKITRQNVEHLLLESIVREQIEALQWINQLESWKRKKLLAGDMRYFHPDRIAETKTGWVEIRAEPEPGKPMRDHRHHPAIRSDGASKRPKRLPNRPNWKPSGNGRLARDRKLALPKSTRGR